MPQECFKIHCVSRLEIMTFMVAAPKLLRFLIFSADSENFMKIYRTYDLRLSLISFQNLEKELYFLYIFYI